MTLHTNKRKANNKKTSYSLVCTVIACAMFLLGLAVYIFPLVNRAVSANNIQSALEIFRNARVSETSASDDNSNTENNSTEGNNSDASSSNAKSYRSYDELYEEMQEYNEKIYEEKQSGLKDAWSYEQAEFDLYQYNVANGVVGELIVPAMDCDLPLYLGATLWNMAYGAVQLGQTSMPIGGENTNCVIAGHRGCTNGRYFLDIENIQIGDMVYIDNLWETLAYKVTEIKIISPTDIDAVKIQDGKDMVTLITCHPYPYNYQRYAVFCERTEYIPLDDDSVISSDTSTENGETDSKAEESVTADLDGGSRFFIVVEDAMVVIMPILLVLLAVLLLWHGHRRRKRRSRKIPPC